MTPPLAPLLRLGSLRLANMVAYSATYVVVPAIVFHGTRSATKAGAAFIVEGLIRAILAMWSASTYAALGSRSAIFAAEMLRLLGLIAIACAVHSFSLVTVVLGSVLFQFGFSIVALEQELRCTELGARAVHGQSAFRLAEVAAMPVVLGVTIIPASNDNRLFALLTLAAISLLTHLLLSRRWYRTDFSQSKVIGDTRLVESARHILRDPLLWRGLVVCVIAFTVFVWSLSGGPFLLAGRHVWSYGMDTPAGIAAFKMIMAAAGGAGAVIWGAALAQGGNHRIAIMWSVAAPSFLAAATMVHTDAIAIGLLALMMGAAVGTLTWQRAYRQAAAPPTLRMGMTTLFLSADCIGMAIAGLALILDAPVFTGLALSTLCLAMSLQAWTRTRASPPEVRTS